MSSPVPAEEIPKEEETEDEIEDDETEEDFEEGDEEFYDEEQYDGDEEGMEMEFDDEFDNGVDLAELLTATLATEDGDTVCTALVTIGEQLATQNKILLKMLSTLSKKDN
jgi:hypothetical protein